jgi:hypothetical protein
LTSSCRLGRWCWQRFAAALVFAAGFVLIDVVGMAIAGTEMQHNPFGLVVLALLGRPRGGMLRQRDAQSGHCRWVEAVDSVGVCGGATLTAGT